MKKITAFLLFGCLLFSLAGCAGKPAAKSNLPPDKLDVELNKNKTNVFADLKLTEGKDVTVAPMGTGMYISSDQQSLFGQDFTLYFLTNVKTHELYGFEYRKDFSGKDAVQDAFTLAQTLLKKLNQAYGSPTTYQGVSSRFSNLTGYQSVENGYYYEQWKYSDAADAFLYLDNSVKDSPQVLIRYKIPDTRTQNNPS